MKGSDVIRLTHAVSLAADMGQDPGQAERMLALVLGGLLNPEPTNHHACAFRARW